MLLSCCITVSVDATVVLYYSLCVDATVVLYYSLCVDATVVLSRYEHTGEGYEVWVSIPLKGKKFFCFSEPRLWVLFFPISFPRE